MTEFDILSDAFYDDPYPVFAAMRKEAPCYYDARLEAHVLTRYHDVERALTDIDTFSARRVKQWGKGAPEEGEEKFTAVAREMETWVPFTDPPEHAPLRARLMEAIGVHLLPRVRVSAENVIGELLTGLDSSSEIDLVKDFTTPAAVWILADLLGVRREEMPRIKQWTSDIFTLAGAGIPSLEVIDAGYAACKGFREYTTALLDGRRRQPGADALSALVAPPKDPVAAKVGDFDLVGLAIALFAAGHESTTNLLGNALHAIFSDPEARACILEHDGITEEQVDELVRYDSAFLSILRKSLKQVMISGQVVNEGDFVLCMINSANRDPRVFKNPDKLNLAAPKRTHIGFSQGLHVCPGAHIVRVVVREAVSQFFRRFPEATTDGARCAWYRNLSMRGMSYFPVKLA